MDFIVCQGLLPLCILILSFRNNRYERIALKSWSHTRCACLDVPVLDNEQSESPKGRALPYLVSTKQIALEDFTATYDCEALS